MEFLVDVLKKLDIQASLCGSKTTAAFSEQLRPVRAMLEHLLHNKSDVEAMVSGLPPALAVMLMLAFVELTQPDGPPYTRCLHIF